MSAPNCEVIGCARVAAYVLASGNELERELYLCERCLCDLSTRLSQAREIYVSLSGDGHQRDDINGHHRDGHSGKRPDGAGNV